MWEVIGSIVLKYWVEFLLGLAVTVGGFFVRRYMKLSKAEREQSQKEANENLQKQICEENKRMVEEVMNVSKTGDEELQVQIDAVRQETKALKAGLLSMQGKEFRAECHRLLDENHVITLDEWEELDADHEAYNGLGGNHKGDHLFELVKKKVENTLTDVN